jgi:hypothetical protein
MNYRYAAHPHSTPHHPQSPPRWISGPGSVGTFFLELRPCRSIVALDARILNV